MFDVIVIGAGPAGCAVASRIAESGYKVLILEEHSKIGLPMQCAGLVSPRIELLLAGIGLNNKRISSITQNRIYGGDIHSPANYVLELRGKRTEALAIDRPELDLSISETAMDNGAEIRKGVQVKGVEIAKDKDKAKVRVGADELECSLVIGADGVASRVSRFLGIYERGELISCYEVEARNLELDRSTVQVFLGSDIAPNFFGWVIPTSDVEARIGVGTSDSPYPAKHYLDSLLQNFSSAEITGRFAGCIPIGMQKSYTYRAMLVGDAAKQVKPLSGGGINFGLECSKYCAETAKKALEADNFDLTSPVGGRSTEMEIGIEREIKIGLKIRSIFKRMEDVRLDTLIKSLSDEELLETIGIYGDIDYPSRLLEPVLAKLMLNPIKILPFAKLFLQVYN